MNSRYLFGPVTPAFAAEHLAQARASGECLTFNAQGGADLTIRPGDRWEDIEKFLPGDWRPSFIALYLPYTSIPAGLWEAPCPLVGLAADWNLCWHWYRHCLRSVEIALTDTAGVEALHREGIPHARAANLYGLERSFLDYSYPDQDRDIDVLFVGNLHPAVQRERLAWLGRLARLNDRWRVVIATGVFGDAYRDLLARSRVVWNRGIRGECNKRAFECAAAGALLFQEAENRETARYFRDRQECVFYTDDDLESLLDHYLRHEDERRALAEAARARVQHFSFASLWQQILREIGPESGRAVPRARERAASRPQPGLGERMQQFLASSEPGDPRLERDLAAALVEAPHAAALHNALGLIAGRTSGNRPPAEAALGYFRRAVAVDPRHGLAGLNLAEALLGCDQRKEAAEQARRTLAVLEREAIAPSPPTPLPRGERGELDEGHFPPAFDLFRVEWERAAWQHAGDRKADARAKTELLRWRLHTLLADLTGELPHFHEAAVARPDLPVTRAALGCALARAGRFADAAPHLRRALAADPFDLPAARALGSVLAELHDEPGSRRLARDRRLLHQAAPNLVPSEPWFAQAAPVGDELVSILVLCHNQLEYTRLCLESVLRHTRAPYELIVIDNASTDGTAAYLEELRHRSGPVRVCVQRNAINRGFPAGCNQGLTLARGRYVVFLNNDTVVTPGWIDGLVRWSLTDWPRVGMVGAVTNASRPPQQIAVAYRELDQLDAFAAERAQEYAGQALVVERLTGFCLLARREVLDQIGGFDERYGVGFFDDDDLSVRVVKAGYRLLVAQDVFVHHFGSRTFTALGVDCGKQLSDNFALFREKWGEQEAAGYQVPVGHVSNVPGKTGTLQTCPTSPRQRVSLCLIVKNEEANLAHCLGPVAGLVDEIVVVDTGSTDRTKAIAAELGARVVDFPWCDSFAAARNESLRHATGDWIFWLDADDRLDETNCDKLKALFAGLRDDNAAYVLKCVCLPSAHTNTVTAVDHVRLFRNHGDIRWKYRVHEQILPGVRATGGDVRWADVVIHHTGYQDPALRGRKLERDLRLLHLEDAEHPDDPFTLFNLGSVFNELGRHAEALPKLERSLARSHPSDSIVRKLYALICQCRRQLGQKDQALTACREGRTHYPEDAELLFLEGLVLRELGRRNEAEAALLRLLAGSEKPHFASVDIALRGYKARQNLAVLYQEEGRTTEAEAQWRAVVQERSDFLPAWLGLAELYLAEQRWPELEEVLGHLSSVEAAVLRARRCLASKDYQPAQQLLEEAIAREPRMLWPRVVLTHVLLQSGQWEPAEKALCDVLALDPDHAEAQRNLAILRQQRGG